MERYFGITRKFWGVLVLTILALTIPMPRSGDLEAQSQPPAQGAAQTAPETGNEVQKTNDPVQTVTPPRKGLEGIQLQESDDVLTHLVPLKPRTVAEQDRLDALAWYGAGRLMEQRQNFPGALLAYEKAFEKDPDSLSVLNALIPLAFGLNKVDAGVKYAIRAAELNPGNYAVIRRIASRLKENGLAADALKLLEGASKAEGVDKLSPDYVLMMRDLGILYRDTEKTKEAAVCFEVVFDALQNSDKYQLNPRNRRELQADSNLDYARLGEIFLNAERPELALNAFQKAAEVRRSNPASQGYNLARAHLALKQLDKANEELRKYLATKPHGNGTAPYELLVKILLELNQGDQSIPQIEELAKADEDFSLLQFYLARLYGESNRFADSEALYKKVLGKNRRQEGYLGLASLYRTNKKPEELIETLSQSFQLSQKLESLTSEIEAIAKDSELLDQIEVTARELQGKDPNKLQYPTGYLLGHIGIAGSRTDFATEMIRASIPTAGTKLGDVIEALAFAYERADRYPDALKVYEEALANPVLTENRPEYLYSISQLKILTRDFDGALSAVRQAREIASSSPIWDFQEGFILSQKADYPAAIAKLEQVVQAISGVRGNPQIERILRQTHTLLSDAYVQQGDIRKGEEILELVFKQNPEEPGINNDLGYLYADQGKNLEQAEQMIAKALKAEPENAAYLDSMAWVLFKLGKNDQALELMNKAIEKSRRPDSTLWDHMGDIQSRLNHHPEALAAWKKSLEQAEKEPRPDTKMIEKLLEKIKQAEKPN